MTTTITNTDKNAAALAALDRGLSQIEPGLWIAHRQRVLRAEASNMRSGINIAKSMSLGSLAVSGGLGLLFGATGIGLVGGGLSLAGYVGTLIADKMDTDRFAPLPFVRTRLGERLETMGNADSRELRSQWEDAQRMAGHSSFADDEELYSNLPSELCGEAMMLVKHGGLVAQMLSQIPTDKRDLAYVHLCNAHRTFGDSMTGLTLERLTDQMEGRVGGNYLKMAPADIHDYQSPVYQMQGDRNFGELAPASDSASILAAASAPAPANTQTALDILVNNAAISRAIYGGQRTGKSYLCAVASRQRKQAKQTRIFFINLNAFDAEDSYYWKHCHRVLAVNIHTMNEGQATSVIESAIAIINEFQNTPNALLIVDEWSSCGSKTMKHQALLEEFTSAISNVNNAVSPTAIKRKQAIWLLTPAIVATEMIQAAKTIKSLQPLVVAVAPGHEVFYDGARLAFDSILYQQVSQNYPNMLADVPTAFDESRMVQIDKAWVSVGVSGHELDGVKGSPAASQSPAPPTTDFKAADHAKPPAPTPTTEPLLSGINKTLAGAADSVARYLQKKEGDEVLVSTLKQAFRSNQREAIAPHLDTIAQHLLATGEGRYMMRPDSEGQARICYQSSPLLPPQ